MVSSIVFWPNVNGLMPALKRQGGKASNADAMVPLLSGLVYMPEGLRFCQSRTIVDPLTELAREVARRMLVEALKVTCPPRLTHL
jgi:hypothetical protein